MVTVLVSNANRMMTAASLLEDGVELAFADGAKGLVPFADLPEVGQGAAVSAIELPNPYELALLMPNGERVEIPWDFARHYCDVSYRPIVEALALSGRRTLGERIRDARRRAGLTQAALARAAGLGRTTLARLEKGEQSPRFKTLNAIADALDVGVEELLTEMPLSPS